METAIDLLTNRSVFAHEAARWNTFRCAACKAEVRLFRGLARAAHFRHLSADAQRPLSVDAQASSAMDRAQEPAKALSFAYDPPRLVHEQVTSVITVVTPRQRERATPALKRHDHGSSTVGSDIVFVGREGGGIRVDTACALFADEDYFFEREPPRALGDLTRRVRAGGPGAWALRFANRDIKGRATLRAWAAQEGFLLRPRRNVVDVTRRQRAALHPSELDETHVLLWTPSWHAAVGLRSSAFKWSLEYMPNGTIVLSGTTASHDADALDNAALEMTVEAEEADARSPSAPEFAPSAGPLDAVTYRFKTARFPLAVALKRRTPEVVRPRPAPAAAVAPAPAPVAKTPSAPARAWARPRVDAELLGVVATTAADEPTYARVVRAGAHVEVCTGCGSAVAEAQRRFHARFCDRRNAALAGSRQCPHCYRWFVASALGRHADACR